MNKYSESEKMKAISEQTQVCGEFLEWLQSKYNLIGKNETFEQSYIPIGYSSFINIERLLAEYFNIDLDLVEQEKIEMLNVMKVK